MSTKIEWTEDTWNPLGGCKEVSPGCTHCYAATMAHRLSAMGQKKYQGTTKKLDNGRVVWSGLINMAEDGDADLLKPLNRKKPTMYFVNSMSDLFHKDVPFEFVDKIFGIMMACPQHTFQVLTKRPERMHEYMGSANRDEEFEYMKVGNQVPFVGNRKPPRNAIVDRWLKAAGQANPDHWLHVIGEIEFPLPNVWLGTSVEDQQRANERIPWLLSCPAAVHFLSCEPLLGPMVFKDEWLPHKFTREPGCDHCETCVGRLNWLDVREVNHGPFLEWVIVGGESGHGARYMEPAWAESLLVQCKNAGVPFFMKQMAMKKPIPEHLMIREMP